MSHGDSPRRYPLVFSFSDLVATVAGTAQVVISGRGLLVEEGASDFVLHGVQPGGIAGVGSEKWEAYSDFRRGVREVLFDIAAASASFEAFRAEVESFVAETSKALVGDWQEAVAEVRAGNVDADWIGRKEHSERHPVGARVQLVAEEPVPELANQPDDPMIIAA